MDFEKVVETVVVKYQDGSGRTHTRKLTAVICDHDPVKYWRNVYDNLKECVLCYALMER